MFTARITLLQGKTWVRPILDAAFSHLSDLRRLSGQGKHHIEQSIVNKEESGLECEQSYR